MLDIEERVLAWVRDFEERTAGGAPTAALVAEGLGLDEKTALTILLCLVRHGHLQPPRFALLKTREDLP
jgi:hypothetical protein